MDLLENHPEVEMERMRVVSNGVGSAFKPRGSVTVCDGASVMISEFYIANIGKILSDICTRICVLLFQVFSYV